MSDDPPPPPPPLDYLTPRTKRAWSLRKRVAVLLAVTVGLIVIIYLGLCVAFVGSNFKR